MEEIAINGRPVTTEGRRPGLDNKKRLGMGLSTVPKYASSSSSASNGDSQHTTSPSAPTASQTRRDHARHEASCRPIEGARSSSGVSTSRRAETSSSQQAQPSSQAARSRLFGTVIPSSNIAISSASSHPNGKQRAAETDDMATPRVQRKKTRRRIETSEDSDESDELNIKAKSRKPTAGQKRRTSPVSASSSQASAVGRVKERKKIEIPSTAHTTSAERAKHSESKTARKCMLKHTRDHEKPVADNKSSTRVYDESDEQLTPIPQKFSNPRKREDISTRRDKKNAKAGTSADDFFASLEREQVDGLRGQVAAEMAARSKDALTFFDEMETNNAQLNMELSEDHDVERRFKTIDALRTSPITSVDEEDERILDVSMVDLSVDDQTYLADFVDPDDLCEFCNKAMPKNMSDHLCKLRRDLYACSKPQPTPQNHRARQAPWQQSIQFCTAHLGESTVIPLGQQRGYPTTIDFINLEERLQEGWIADRLDEMLRQPQACRSFVEAKKAILASGKIKWDAAQRNRGVQAIIPGYYGQLGRVVLNNHFRQLIRWGVYSLADDQGITLTWPLSTSDFISYILIPEAATLLIVQDKGYDCLSRDEALSDRHHEEAAALRLQSSEYGRWKFPEESKEAAAVLQHLSTAVKQKKAKFRRLARSKREAEAQKASERMAVVVVDSDEDDHSTAASKDEIITPPFRRSATPNESTELMHGRKTLSQLPGEQGLSQGSLDDPWADMEIDEAFCAKIDQAALRISP